MGKGIICLVVFMTDMVYVTISLSNQDKNLLDDLCKKERRGKSNMFVYALTEYAKSVGVTLDES